MNRVGILVLTVSASLCLAVSVRGDPAGPARAYMRRAALLDSLREADAVQ